MFKNHHLAVFLGSGASKSAGLPLAYELLDKIISKLGLSPQPNLTLEELLQQIKDRQGKDAFNIIAETVEKVTIPPTGYDYLASLVKEGLVKVIFTTNYDRLL